MAAMRTSALPSLLMLAAMLAATAAVFPACALGVSCAGSADCVMFSGGDDLDTGEITESALACCSGPRAGETSPAVGAKPERGVSGLVALVSPTPLAAPPTAVVARHAEEGTSAGEESRPLYTLHSALLR